MSWPEAIVNSVLILSIAIVMVAWLLTRGDDE